MKKTEPTLTDRPGKLRPIPTIIKERINPSCIALDDKLKSIEGQEAIAVTTPGSESKVIIREQFFYELINLCNTLMFDELDYETDPIPDAAERKEMLGKALGEIDRIYEGDTNS